MHTWACLPPAPRGDSTPCEGQHSDTEGSIITGGEGIAASGGGRSLQVRRHYRGYSGGNSCPFVSLRVPFCPLMTLIDRRSGLNTAYWSFTRGIIRVRFPPPPNTECIVLRGTIVLGVAGRC